MSTADRLIEAAEAALDGYRPEAVQQRAGAGRGSLCHHFAGRPDLVLAAVRRTAAELRGWPARPPSRPPIRRSTGTGDRRRNPERSPRPWPYLTCSAAS
ncbi:hypothetical protein ACFQ2K_45515 [Streptomyces sanglieri]|uniref:TetR family transcriptional regulator n=1 Tax=Streptomyces sanglieri TaxID=193460 RepID=A0ABW2X4T0_9ACTN